MEQSRQPTLANGHVQFLLDRLTQLLERPRIAWKAKGFRAPVHKRQNRPRLFRGDTCLAPRVVLDPQCVGLLGFRDVSEALDKLADIAFGDAQCFRYFDLGPLAPTVIRWSQRMPTIGI